MVNPSDLGYGWLSRHIARSCLLQMPIILCYQVILHYIHIIVCKVLPLTPPTAVWFLLILILKLSLLLLLLLHALQNASYIRNSGPAALRTSYAQPSALQPTHAQLRTTATSTSILNKQQTSNKQVTRPARRACQEYHYILKYVRILYVWYVLLPSTYSYTYVHHSYYTYIRSYST